MFNKKQRKSITTKNYWLYGVHASKAALNNKKREIIKIAIEHRKKKKYENFLNNIATDRLKHIKISYEFEEYFVNKFGKRKLGLI